MVGQISRRNFIKFAVASGGAIVVGFDPGTRSWIPRARAETHSFQSVPKLDGMLLFDEPSRKAIAVDHSNLFHRIPAAVLKPTSVQDVVRIVRYANTHSLKVAIRGDGHSQYGQTQAEGGIVIDSRTLNAIRVRSKNYFDAQPGAFWGDVARATLPEGLTPPVYPATCMGLTVGGTLSVGGIGSTSNHHGAQVDTATELDVVTGDGRLVTCSPSRESELFNMVLAGLGQCGIIVRSRIRLIPAPSYVMLQDLVYTDLDKYLEDHLRAVADGRFDSQRGGIIRDKNGKWSFTIEAGKFFSPPGEPNLASLVSDLRFDSATPAVRMTYQEYLFRFEARNAASAARFPNSLSRFITMWLPASAVKDYLSNIFAFPPELAALPQVGGFERISFFPMNTRRFTRPLFKLPSEDRAFAVWLFRSVSAGDQARLSAVTASNRDLFAKMTAIGGKRYSPYSGVISPAEWQEHFGLDTWRRLSAAKKKYDPNNVLTPGPNMFT